MSQIDFEKISRDLYNPHYEKAVLCTVMHENQNPNAGIYEYWKEQGFSPRHQRLGDEAGRKMTLALESLCEDDFTVPGCRAMFQAMKELSLKSEPFDPLTVYEFLKSKGASTDMVDTVMEVYQYNGDNPTSHIYFFKYLKHIREKAKLRRYAQAFGEGYDSLYDAGMSDDERLAKCESHIINLSIAEKEEARTVEAKDVIGDIARQATAAASRGLAMGYEDFDRMTGGFEPGDMIILCGYPSHGKSALALNFVERVALRKKRCLIFSAEMTTEQLFQRLLSQVGKINGYELRGKISDYNLRLMNESAAKIHTMPISICDKAGISVMEIVSRAKSAKKQHPDLSFVVVDYLQRVQGLQSESRNLEVGSVSGTLKNLAKELSVPILVVASLTKPERDKKGDLRLPSLWSMRDSGEPGYDCDIGFTIRRNEIFGGKKNVCTIGIDKNRKGQCGEVKLAWFPEYTRFEDYEERDEND